MGKPSRYLSRHEIEQEIESIKIEPKNLIRLLFILLVLFILAITCRSGLAAQVALQWDANQPAPTGYRLFQRIDGQPYDYSLPVWQGSDTTAIIEDLAPGMQYYFVVRAYVGDNESGDSNEVDFTPEIAPPANLRINMEISVYIDVNGVPYIAQRQIQSDQGVVPMQ